VPHYDIIRSTDALKALIDKVMSDEKKICFDLETGYLGPDRPKGALQIDWDQQFIAGFSITNSTNWARYVPVAHDYGSNLPEAETWELMKPVLETLPSTAHNAKFEIRNLRALDRKGRGPRIDLNVKDDTALQSYVLSKYQRHSLKSLSKEEFDYEQPELASLFPDAKKKDLDALRFSVLDLSDPKVTNYACDDVVRALLLEERFLPQVQTQRAFIYAVEMHILPIVCDMEDAGHEVDWEAIREAYALGLPFEEEMKSAAKSMLSQLAGEDLSKMNDGKGLNLASAPQMRTVLYEKIGLSTTRQTPKGEPSTDAIALEGLSREHPAVKKVLEVREVANLRKRLDKWLTQYTGMYDGRVHASFNQVAAHTITGGDGSQAPPSGRFSAADPAIQQLPKDWRWSVFPKVSAWNDDHWAVVKERAVCGKQYWDGNFRDFMIAADGCYLLFFDYSQIELRALAGMSQEPALLKAFNDNIDVHTMTAAQMLKIPLEEAQKSKNRGVGKTMNFALLYGMGEESLAERLAITLPEAERLYADYFSAFSLVTDWMNTQKAYGKSLGYVETAFGRKVTIWDFQSRARGSFGKGQRLCVNAPVQGTAADIMKLAMIRAVRALQKRGWWMTKVRMINNIHDCLGFEVDNSINPDELRAILAEAVVWDVVAPDGTRFPKIVADWEIGQKWGSCKKWKRQPVEFVDGVWALVCVGDPKECPDEDTGGCEICKPSADGSEVEFSESQPESEPEPVREDEEPDRLIVELTAMPSRDGFAAFTKTLTERPGKTVITLKTPQGEVDLHDYPTDLGTEDQGLVSMLLGGARLFRPVEEIDTDTFTEGLVL
jgi:DNA polymerase-1